MLDLVVAPPARAATAATLLSAVAAGEVQLDTWAGRLSVPIEGGAVVPDAVRLLDGAGITIAELSVRRPTLDDVFLGLTGEPAEAVARPRPQLLRGARG